MSSFIKDPPQYAYHRLQFKNRKKTPQTKVLYFKKSEWSRRAVTRIKTDLDYKYKIGEFDPWTDSVVSDDPVDAITLSEAIEAYKQSQKTVLAKSTLETYGFFLSTLQHMVGAMTMVCDITAKMYNEFINAPRFSDGKPSRYHTRRSRMAVVGVLVRWLADQGHIEAVPKLEVVASRAEKNKKRKTYITSGEFEKVCQALRDMEKAYGKRQHVGRYRSRSRLWMEDAFRIAFYQGLRLADIMNMTRDWVSADHKFLYIGDIGHSKYIPKSQRGDETIPIVKEVLPIFRRLCQDEKSRTAPLMGDHRAEWLSKTFKACCRQAIPEKAERVSFHSLRDSAAMYWLIEREMPLRVVQQLFRHSDVKITEIYTHANPHALWEKLNTG